ncbi:MAG: hypothetical protein V3R99_12835 [Thermoguttaceae bacterium]
MKNLHAMLAIAVLLTSACSNAWAQKPGDSIVDLGAESASHEEVDSISVEFEWLSALQMHTDGNLLACDRGANVIRVIDPAGKLVASIQLEFGPEAIDVAADGTIYCGGGGQLAKMNADGKVLLTATIPDPPRTPEQQPRRYASEPHRVSGIAAGKEALFVAFGEGGHRSSKSKLFRFDLDLNDPKQIAEDLRGCCQRCDVATRDGIFYVAENTAHRIVRFGAKGEVLGHWGEQSRTELEGFGSCCNPMNLCFGPDGVLYTSESGMARVKRYTAEGKFLGLVGYVGTTRFSSASGMAASCSNISIAVAAEGDRIYVMDYTNRHIRVLQKKQ